MGIDDWDLEPNSDAPGGRVIVVEGDLASRPELLQGWCGDARALGNAPVDMLACVSPVMVPAGPSGQLCRPAAIYEGSGGMVWDGTTRDVREHFPTHRDQLRFVQYDSCRGLEGWTVINFQLDTLWDYKRSQWFSEDHVVDDLYRTAEESAAQHASRWVMIPLTRAIDTLVINIGRGQSFVRNSTITLRISCVSRYDQVAPGRRVEPPLCSTGAPISAMIAAGSCASKRIWCSPSPCSARKSL